MNVPSFQFLLFVLVVAILCRITPSGRWRQIIMLVANIVFLGTFFSGNPLAFLPFAGFILLGYVGLHRAPRRLYGWLMVAAVIVVFFWLKKYTFIPSPLFLPFPYFTIGLSYVFFRVLHLVIDTEQESLPHRPGLLSYLNYTLNFTSLVSGPIQRYEDYHGFEAAPAPPRIISFGQSAERIVIGFFKVFIASPALLSLRGQLIDSLAADPAMADRIGTSAMIVALSPIYLYFNFSGYTDVVIGAARWFGLILPENFNRPFQAESIILFWGRWHMTLSNWLRTYVYQPMVLRLMERAPGAAAETVWPVFALFVTFFLVGAWHGQTGAFLFFGVLQGLGVGANRLYQIAMTKRLGRMGYRKLAANWLYRAGCRGLTFTWFSFTMLWFWMDWDQIFASARQLGPAVGLLLWPVLLVAAVIVLGAWTALFEAAMSIGWQRKPVVLSRYIRVMWSTALATVVAVLTFVLNAPAPPIVYKNF